MPNGPHGRGRGTQKPQKMGYTIKRTLMYLKPYWLRLLFVSIAVIVSSLMTVSVGIYLKYLVDDGITPLLGQTNPDLSHIIYLIEQLALIVLVGIIGMFYYTKAMVTISQKVLKTLRDEMFQHMQSLPIRYFDTNGHGDIMSRYTNDIDAMVNMLSQSFPQVVSGVLQVIAVIIAMIVTSIPLTFVVLISMLIIVFVSSRVGGLSKKYFAQQQSSLGKENSYIEELVSGQQVVKVFAREQQVNAEFDEINELLKENTFKANKFSNIFMPVIQMLSNFQYAAIAVAGGFMEIHGYSGLTLGMIISFLQLSQTLSRPLGHMSQQINAVVQALAGAERIYHLLDEKSEVDEGRVVLVNACQNDKGELTECSGHTGHWAWKKEVEGKTELICLRGAVRLDHVDFSYNADKQILKDINVHAHPGQIIAFVGSTGAGKTTITNLINRFYEIDNGTISIDGINVKDIAKKDLRHSLGIVLQDTSLFTATIKDNIRFGKLDATDEEVIAAAKIAGADHFIRLLPKGYDTLINGKEANLSTGQRQLLAIARATIADPPIMILDEATSSIDTRTEALIQKGMDRLMDGRTVFVIAHRLSTIRGSNVIMVLENGEIIEKGNHQELMEKQGKYYQLYTGKVVLS
jgi:ATP-binding cassette subfamily B protein